MRELAEEGRKAREAARKAAEERSKPKPKEEDVHQPWYFETFTPDETGNLCKHGIRLSDSCYACGRFSAP